MKKIPLFCLILTLSLGSCKKNGDPATPGGTTTAPPEPDWATPVSGDYKGSFGGSIRPVAANYTAALANPVLQSGLSPFLGMPGAAEA